LMREVASSGKHFSVSVMSIFLKTMSILDNILETGYKDNIFNKNDAKIVHFIIIGSISYITASKPIRHSLKKKFDKIPDFITSQENAKEVLYKIILKGLEKR
jgi:hypothetical protein